MRKAALERFRQAVVSKPIDAVVNEFLNSDNPVERGLAVNVLAALDNLDGLAAAVREAKHPDVWENGVLAFRSWIGRGPGQDQILYKRLVEVSGYKPVHAETVMQLLHSFGEDDMAQPETYEILVMYLNHEKLAIRGLAHWHLVRLVPEGKKIAYDAAAPEAQRQKAFEQWRALVPPGQLPPQLRKAGAKK